jgi:hypothetical protein
MKKREIEKNPVVPDLSERAQKLLTELCFRNEDVLRRADVLFIFGTRFGIPDIAATASDIILHGLVKSVVVAGGNPSYPDVPHKDMSEAEEIVRAMKVKRFPSVVFHSENKSHHTLDNVKRSLVFPEFKAARRVIFIFRSHACGRGYLTLRTFLPHVELIQKSVPIAYQKGVPSITRDNWATYPSSRQRVWGEFLRIEKYGSRGDIHYPAFVQRTVSEIRKETTRA